MRNGLKWTLATFAFLLVAASVAWATSRYLGLGAADRETLRLMREPWQPQGRNAFAAVWTLSSDVPAELQERVTAADMRAVAARSVPGRGPSPWTPYSPAPGYPALAPVAEDAALFCRTGDSCLAKVQADIERYERLVARNARLIGRADALAGYDHFRTLLPKGPGVDTPTFAHAYAPATRDALLFARGERGQALDNACRGIATWRRLAANNDFLLGGLTAAAYATDGYGRLFADMLAQLPAGEALPASCDVALAEVRPDELSLCRALRTEFAYSERSLAATLAEMRADTSWPRPGLFFDPESAGAMLARTFAPACDADASRRLADDTGEGFAPKPAMRSRYVCLSNPTGCMLVDIAAPSYAGYARRMQDHGMKLRALAALRWLHDRPQPGVALQARLAQLPASMRTPTRRPRAGTGGTQLVVPLHERSEGSVWTLPVAR